jgi:hypothetical protein
MILRAFTLSLTLSFGLLLLPQRAAAADFTLKDITIDVGGTTYRAANVAVAGSTLSQDEMSALLDPKNTTPATARLAKLDAVSLSAPELSVDQSVSGATQHIVYRDVVFDMLKSGQIERVTSSGATLAMHSPQGDDITGTIGAISFQHVDLVLLAHMLVEGRSDANEAARIVVGEGRTEAIDFNLPNGGKAHVASLTFRNLGGRALAVPMASLVDLAPKPDQPALPPSPERQRALAALFADIFTSQTVGSLELAGLTVQPAAGLTTTLAKVTVNDLAAGRIGAMGFEGLSIALPDNGNVTIGGVTLSGLDLKPVLAQGADSTGGATRAFPHFDRLDLKGFSGRFASPGGKPLNIVLDKAGLAASGWLNAAPTKLALDLDHLAFDLPADDPHWRPLRDLGYTKLDLTLGAQSAYDPDKQELIIPKVSLSAPDLGSVEVSARLNNVDAALIGQNIEKARAALAASLFRHATIVVRDSGLLTRLIDTQARHSNATAEAIRARWAASTRQAATALLAQNADRGAVADAAEKFVQHGGALTVEADAANGFGLIDVMLAGGLQGVLEKLKLTAHN